MEKFKCNEYGLFHDRNGSWRMWTDNSLCGRTGVWKCRIWRAFWNRRDRDRIEESGTDESDPDEIQSEENAEETEPEETEDSEEKDQDKANLSDGKSEEEDKENENKKKTPNFTVSVVTDESTVKAGSDLVYTVTLENTGDVMLKNIQLRALFSNQNLQGEWSGDNLEQLDVGIKKELYLTVRLPENQESAVSVKIAAICS